MSHRSLLILLLVACNGSDTETDSGPDQPDTSTPTDTDSTDTGGSDSGGSDTSEPDPNDADGDGFPVEEDCDDTDPWLYPGVSGDPVFDVDRCGQGQRFEGMDTPSEWAVYTDGIGSTLSVTTESGCHDTGIQFDWSLGAHEDPNWVVMRKELSSPVDLSTSEFLLIPFSGTPGDDERNLELKLEDANGCRTTLMLWNATNLDVYRTMVVALDQFTAEPSTCGNALDLSTTKALEIGISEYNTVGQFPSDGASGTLHFDDWTTVNASDLMMTMDHFECVEGNPDVLSAVANDLLARQAAHGLVPSWYSETPTRYYTYNQANALAVFALEAERTGDAAFTDAAERLATQLLSLQVDGGWVDYYQDDDAGGVMSPNDIAWVGNVSWSMIGLRIYANRTSDPTLAEAAISAGADWLKAEMDEFTASGGPAGGINAGVEGNLSAYFALVAARETEAAQDIADFLMGHAWDGQRLWVGINDPGIALDVIGNWGSQFLRHQGLHEEALTASSLGAGLFAVQAWDESMVGMGDIGGPWQPSVEFTGQYIAAGGVGAQWLLEQLQVLEDPQSPGAYPGSPNDYSAGIGWNTSMYGIAPSSWVYFAHHGGILLDL